MKVTGEWTSLYRAVDQHGQVIDVLLSLRRDQRAARRFCTGAPRAGTIPDTVEQYANDPIETDHGRLTARLRPMRGPNTAVQHGSSPPGTPSDRTCARRKHPPTPPPCHATIEQCKSALVASPLPPAARLGVSKVTEEESGA